MRAVCVGRPVALPWKFKEKRLIFGVAAAAALCAANTPNPKGAPLVAAQDDDDDGEKK